MRRRSDGGPRRRAARGQGVAVLALAILAVLLPQIPFAAEVDAEAAIDKIQLSSGPAEGSTAQVAAVDRSVYTVWQDRSLRADGFAGVAFRRSLDGGRTFEARRNLAWPPNVHLDARDASIAANGDDVVVAWSEGTSLDSDDRGDEAVWIVSSHDRGATFGTPQRLDWYGDGRSRAPHVLMVGRRVHVQWTEENQSVMVATSRDRGNSFDDPTEFEMNGRPLVSDQPLAAFGSTVAVTWAEQTSPESIDVVSWAAISADDGRTFGEPSRISETPGTHHSPVAAVTADGVTVAWSERVGVEGTGLYDNIVRARSSVDSESWGSPAVIGRASEGYGAPAIVADESRVTVAWRDASTWRAAVASARVGDGFTSPRLVTREKVDGAVTLGAPIPTSTSGPSARFDWSMPDRFGADADGDGLVDYDTSASFVAPSNWVVDLDGCGSTSPDGAGLSYRWFVDGAPLAEGTDCRQQWTPATEGTHRVRLEVAEPDGDTSSRSQDVEVQDRVVVSIGDSVASGEGNPDVPSAGSWPWDAASRWQDRQCNRSAKAGPALAAASLEAADAHESVTFVHLACSGASVLGPDAANGGLLTDYSGINPDQGTVLAPQLDQLPALTQGREVDALFISIGANDLHFSEVVKNCIVLPLCQYGDTGPEFDARLAELPSHYAALDARLRELGIPSDRVFITEYFDPTINSDGAVDLSCVAAPVDGFGPVLDSEAEWARSHVVLNLNASVTAAAQQYGWNLVGGIADAYATHGYCSDDTWVVSLGDSFGDQNDKNGAFHPNNRGHELYGERIAAEVQRVMVPAASPATDAPDPGGAVDPRGDVYLGWEDGRDVHVTALRESGAELSVASVQNLSSAATTIGAERPRVAATAFGAFAVWHEAIRDDASTSKFQAFFARAATPPANLAVEQVRLVQAADDTDLVVAGKRTAVEAVIQSDVEHARTVFVRTTLRRIDGTAFAAQSSPVPLEPGRNVVLLDVSGDGMLPAGTEELSATVEVDSEQLVNESTEADNTATTAVHGVRSTRPVRVLYVPLGVSCAEATTVANAAGDYLGTVLPLASDSLETTTSCALELDAHVDTGAGVGRTLATLSNLARVSGYDSAVGVVRRGRLSNGGAPGSAGVALVGSTEDRGDVTGGAIVEVGNGPGVVAHELGHNFGLDHTDGLAATGWLVRDRQRVEGTDFMNVSTVESPWIAADAFDFLARRLQAAAPAAVAGASSLVVTGSIAADGTVLADPWYVDDSDPTAELGSTGALQLELQGADGSPLGTVGLHAAPVHGTAGDVAGAGSAFSARVPMIDGLARLVLRQDGRTLLTREVSAGAPTVEVTAPAADAEVGVGGELSVAWTAADPDGDELSSNVEVRVDDGPWRPVAGSVTGASVSLTATQDLVGQVRFRVTTTDGVRSSRAESSSVTVDGGAPAPETRVAVVRNTEDTAVAAGPLSLWTSNLDGGDLRLVHDGLGLYAGPDFSPDGARIAFSSAGTPEGASENGKEDVFVVGLDGSGLVDVTAALTGGFSHSCPDFSPDGTELAVIARHTDLPDEVRVVDLDDGSVRTIATGLSSPGNCPRWSPDGSTIAYDTATEVRVVPAGGGESTLVAAMGDGTHAATLGDWSPDGARLLIEGFGSVTGLWTVAPDGSDPVRIVSQLATTGQYGASLWVYEPKFLPDGSGISFNSGASSTGQVDGYRMRQWCTMALDGSGRRCRADVSLSQLGGGVMWPDVSAAPVQLPAPAPLPEPAPPVSLTAGGPYLATEDGDPVTLGAWGGFAPGEVPTVEWDLDDDGEFDDARGSAPQVVLHEPGTVPVAVRMTAADGRTATAHTHVAVTPTAAVVDPMEPFYGGPGRPVTLRGSFQDAGSSAHTVRINWGEGVIEELPLVETPDAGTFEARHTYATAGMRDVYVEVCDAGVDVAACASQGATAFVFDSATPLLDRLEPATSGVAGGGTLTISGELLEGVTSVRFGDVEAAFTQVSESRVTATVPASPTGGAITVPVVVTTAGGSSVPDDVSMFTYVENHAPTAVGLDLRTAAGTAVSAPLAADDADGDLLTFRIADAPAHGRIVREYGGTRYEPDAGFVGSDTFTYVADDGYEHSAPATVRVAVGNLAPRPVDDTLASTVAAGEQLVIDPTELLANDVDPDGGTLRVVSALDGADTHGTVARRADGSVVVRVDAGSSGPASFRYVVGDGQGATASATVQFQIVSSEVPDEAPTVDAGADLVTVEGAAHVLGAVVSDDHPGVVTRWTVREVSGVRSGASCVFADPGSVSSTVTCDDDGVWAFTLTATDAAGQEHSDELIATVHNVAPTVSILEPSADTDVPSGVSVTVVASAIDPGVRDAPSCSIDWGDGTSSTATVTEGRCSAAHTWTAAATRKVVVTAADGQGGSSSATRTLRVVSTTSSSGRVAGFGLLPASEPAAIGVLVTTPSGGSPRVWLQALTAGGHRFTATSIQGLSVSRRTASWSGTGSWDGRSGYSYKVTTVDNGVWAPLIGRDTVRIEVRDVAGAVVWSTSGDAKLFGPLTVRS